MRYFGRVFRPPSEAYSHIVQVTYGCSHNTCAFCSMFKEKRFAVRPLDEVLEDFTMAKQMGYRAKRIFLADGDALVRRADELAVILDHAYACFPECERVTAYASPSSLLVRTEEELRMLRQKGLTMVYLGLESGSDAVLTMMRKGHSEKTIVEAGKKARRCGMALSVTAISGLGGTELWQEHAVETARANGALATTGRTFRPDANITREEMAAMLVRGLGYASLAGTLSGEKSPFTDVKTNRGFITVAYDLGIVSGVGGGLFAPGSTATREQAAAMMVRVSRRLYAGDRRVESVGDRTALRVPTPAATEEQSMPTTPLEPLPALYQELHRLKSRGVDMSRVVLCLSGGGVRTVTSGGRILQTDELTAREVSELLEQPGVRTYYSDRYESAYCISQTNGYQTATLWYQSGESMAAKLQLARLFGVTSYILEEPERPDSGK